MKRFSILALYISIILSPVIVFAQIERTDYFVPGEAEKELMIIVHIWGEVHNPGKFVVSDGSDLIRLISEAGGPTEFANLKRVFIAHKGDENPHIDIFNMEKYILRENVPVPVMLPGDVVVVKRSTWGFLLDIGKLTGQMTVVLNTIWIVLSISNLI